MAHRTHSSRTNPNVWSASSTAVSDSSSVLDKPDSSASLPPILSVADLVKHGKLVSDVIRERGEGKSALWTRSRERT